MRIWNKEKIIESAKPFNSISLWREKYPSAYANAFRNGFLKEATSHMAKRKYPVKITDDQLLTDAKKYKTRKEWIEKSRSKYFTALNRGLLDLATAHMDKNFRRKSKQEIIDSAKKYASKIQWLNADRSSYFSSKKRGFFEEASAHMKRFGQTSVPEQELLKKIQDKFPSAGSKWFQNKDKDAKINRFQLDIYIPELKKAIEFNGTYWHSLEGLRRGRPSWTDEELLQYQDIKISFFKKLSIDVLNVDQKQWQNDPETTLNKIFIFLTNQKAG